MPLTANPSKQRSTLGLEALPNASRIRSSFVETTESLPLPTPILSTRSDQPQVCQTCQKFHKDRGDQYYNTTCILIGVKTYCEQSADMICYPMHQGVAEHQEMGRAIWAGFQRQVAQNNALRKSLQEKHGNTPGTVMSAHGTPLREQAPMIWLYWKSADGSRGQTRNAERFRNKWEDLHIIVGPDGWQRPVGWLTISLAGDWPFDESIFSQIHLGEVTKSMPDIPQSRYSPIPCEAESLDQRTTRNATSSVDEDSSIDNELGTPLRMVGDIVGGTLGLAARVHHCPSVSPTPPTVSNRVGLPSRKSSRITNVAEMRTAQDLVNMRLVWYQRGMLL